MSVKITVELASVLELEALEQALELYVELEGERIADKHADVSRRDRQRFEAAMKLVERLRGGER